MAAAVHIVITVEVQRHANLSFDKARIAFNHSMETVVGAIQHIVFQSVGRHQTLTAGVGSNLFKICLHKIWWQTLTV